MTGAEYAVSGAFLVTVALKATVVIVIAGILALLLKRASSAARYWVWATAVLSTLLLPLSSAIMPSWEVPVEMPGLSASASVAAAGSSVRSQADGSPRAAETTRPSLSRVGFSPQDEVAAPSGSTPADPRAQQAIARGLSYVWALGVLTLLLRILVGWLQVYRLRCTAEPMREPAWVQLLNAAAREAGISQEIDLLRSDSAAMPMTWGLARPVVLLPSYADSWPSERRRIVLLHELAHVARRDCLMQALAEITCALYWFHPLVWFASRRLRVEREKACDDRVLAAGESASAYAGHLLEVARVCRGLRSGSAVTAAMARPSHLEGRLLAILDRRRDRHGPGRGARAIGVAAAASVLTFLGGASAASAPPSTDTGELRDVPIAADHAADIPRPYRDSVGRLPKAESAISPEGDSSSHALDLGRVELAVVGEAASSADMRTALDEPRLLTTGADRDTSLVYSIAANPGEEIQIDLHTGGEVRIVGWSLDSVEVRATGRGHWKPGISLTRNATGVRFTSSFGPGESETGPGHFEIRVPASAQLIVRSAMGGITVDGVRGSVSGHTGGGDIQLDRLDGELRLSTGRGEVLISDSDVTGEVRTVAGDLRLRNVKGGVHVITAAGRGYFDNAGARMTAIPPGD